MHGRLVLGEGSCKIEGRDDSCQYLLLDSGLTIQLALKNMPFRAFSNITSLYCGFPDCFSEPCLHGGQCKEEVHGFSCNCRVGYGGLQCESACQTEPCINGGTCAEEIGGYRCSCPRGFAGAHCEHSDICPEEWVTGKTKCFKVDGYRNEYYESTQHCRYLGDVTLGSGHLVQPSLLFIEEEEDFTFLSPHLNTNMSEGVWVNCWDGNGQWKCYPDSYGYLIGANQSSYRNWADNLQFTVGNNCAIMDPISGKWYDEDCYVARFAVCQVNIPSFGIHLLA
ncbi:neurogenic locus notch homolog protein 4-like [Lytechinus variegatus]|uniref:neurogenic locus notch homolog protein 4-like n=1 Tax=Lytechinus variegatus TaxID=7654 RepID=UPI001BB24441|nr:neurogenic locus notch homolog protein 4-like [Lytechinus variegatus]